MHRASRTYRFFAAFSAALLFFTSSLPLVQHACAHALDLQVVAAENAPCPHEQDAEPAPQAMHPTHDAMAHGAMTHDAAMHHAPQEHAPDCDRDPALLKALQADADCCSVEVQQADLDQVVASPSIAFLILPVFHLAGVPLLLSDEAVQPPPPRPVSDHTPPVRTHLLLSTLLN